MDKDIYTDRLLLRKLTLNDAEAMFSNWANDPEVTKYMTWSPHENIEVTKMILDMWVKEYSDVNTHRFGIVLKESNELIGAIDVVEYRDNIPVIGYCLSRKYWNHGYMSEACKAFIDFLFSIGHKQIFIEAHVDNIGSNRVIEKCGFEYIDTVNMPHSASKPEIVAVNRYRLIRK